MRAPGIVVVGAGPAGVAAAAQCARLGIAPEVLDRTGRAGGLVGAGFLVENYPGLEPLPGPELARRLAAHLDRFGLSVREEEAVAVEARDRGWLVCTDRGERPAAEVILCAGTRPKPWSAPGAAGLAGDRVFDDVRDLIDRRGAVRTALVVGGGEAAFDFALSLARIGAQVSILVRGDSPRAAGRLRALVADQPRIRVETRVALAALEPAAGGVTAILETPRGSERRAADAVLAAVGRERALDDLLPAPVPEPCPLEPAPGLFVCGDARLGALGQAGIAVGDGLAAAALAVARAREAAR